MIEQKYVAISVKNLSKIMDWCNGEGEDTQLAEAYLSASCTVYITAIQPNPDAPVGWYEIGRNAYKLRDSIGRFILAEMKK